MLQLNLSDLKIEKASAKSYLIRIEAQKREKKEGKNKVESKGGRKDSMFIDLHAKENSSSCLLKQGGRNQTDGQS